MPNTPSPGKISPSNIKSAIFLVSIAVAAVLLCSYVLIDLDPRQISIDAMKGVIYSAIEKNPDIIDQILSSPETTRKQIHAIVLAKPEIQSLLKSNDQWQQRDQLFTSVWDEITAEFQAENTIPLE